jgi:predicted enzyme related to lactoylglutathione lyase
MPRVIQFAIGAHDPEQEAEFYQAALGWAITRKEMPLPWGSMPYWEIQTGAKDTPGIDGFMLARPEPGAITVNVIEVPSLDEAVGRVELRGGTVVEGRQPVPGIGWLAVSGPAGHDLRYSRTGS